MQNTRLPTYFILWKVSPIYFESVGKKIISSLTFPATSQQYVYTVNLQPNSIYNLSLSQNTFGERGTWTLTILTNQRILSP